MKETYHWLSRDERIEFIKKEIGGGNSYRTFYWDRHHPKGPEVHIITTTGIIVVKNYYTRKLVTVLIARPGQIKGTLICGVDQLLNGY
jgi:hypothetical protein